ncbi:MAG TPA: hypothetical protein VEZ14_01175 [Dehalococcoidia bacterium]|nr:hypothetical protein [Dehalococcoidia bacterium]
MRALASVAASLVIAALLILTAGGNVALASFHCVRIHAVMGGFAGNGMIQYVELRMDAAGQNLIAGHVLEFRDATGTLKATFTFPTDVTNASTGDSILIATQELNAAATGGAADYTFSMANTTGANGGDPLHPVQGPNGKVVWAPTFANCSLQAPVDSVAYGTAPATYGTAAVALPNPSDARSLRLNNLALSVTNNSTEYGLQPVAASTFSVAVANLPTDFSTPRNNGRVVLKLSAPAPPSVGGIAEAPSLAGVAPAAAAPSRGSTGYAAYGAAVAALALMAAAGGAGWYAYRRRVRPDR